MVIPQLLRYESCGVSLLGDQACPGGVTFAFTERCGGVSSSPYASLNLGLHSGDDLKRVKENRRRALRALGVPQDFMNRVVSPRQVHGTHVCVVDNSTPRALAAVQEEASLGADAVVCSVEGVPVMLSFADCVPLVLVAPGGFAVVHSGWKGTLADIAGIALEVLVHQVKVDPCHVLAYIGPHITGSDYEVSQDLLDTFVATFGTAVQKGQRHLDLSQAIRTSLVSRGVLDAHFLDCDLSTASNTSRFFSYRAEGSACGRHGALAWIAPKKRVISAEQE